MPALEVLNADTATTSVSIIEAKGHNSDPSAADIRRGIKQAHGYLSEGNIGLLTKGGIGNKDEVLSNEWALNQAAGL